MAAAAGPATLGQGPWPRNGAAESPSLGGGAGPAPWRQAGGDIESPWGHSRPVAEACAGSANFMRLKPVSEGTSLTYRRAGRGKANASIAPCLRPAWLQLFAHLLAQACKSRCRATADRLEATCRTAPGSRSRPRSGGALGRAGLDPAASADLARPPLMAPLFGAIGLCASRKFQTDSRLIAVAELDAC